MQGNDAMVSVGLPQGTMIWGRYRVEYPIGMGGFGITYRAYDTEFGSVVAVKEYFPSGIVSRSPDGSVAVMARECEADYLHGIDRFLREARDVAFFRENPSIVKVYNFFKENGTAYMVMEFLEGCTLKDYIEQNGGRIDYAMAIQVIFTMMETLEEVHTAGLVHRDISPDNIFVCNDSSVRLIDFGAAKISSNLDNHSASVVLKQGYAPVEQYSSKGNIGPWTDVYAFGALMYFMLTGEKPPESIDRMMDDEIVPPVQKNPAITPAINRVIMKALQMKVEDRYQNMAEMRADLLRGEESRDAEQRRGNSEVLTSSMKGNSEVLTSSMKGNSEVLTSSMKGNSEVLTSSMQGHSEVLKASMYRGMNVQGQPYPEKGNGKKKTLIISLVIIAVGALAVAAAFLFLT